MNKTPIIYTYESWANSQLSIARYAGCLRLNGHDYLLVSSNENRYTPDLVIYEWVRVYKKLGRTKTMGLVKNGTSLKVAKEMVKAMEAYKQELPKLF